jgi:formylglycine-generating enzyme required for sulfatase activity
MNIFNITFESKIMNFITIAAALVSIFGLGFGQEKKEPIAVLDLKAEGVSQTIANILSNKLRTEMFGAGTYNVLNREDMKAILGEQEFQQSGMCDDTKCLARIGGALGVIYMVSGSIGKIGDTYIISLKMIDIEKIVNVKIVDEQYSGKEDGLIMAVQNAARKLMGLPVLLAEQATVSGSKPAVPAIEGMIWIEGGTFMMGSGDEGSWLSSGTFKDEKPAHTVTVDGFYMDKTEVTQEQYEQIMGNNPSKFKDCPTCPVDNLLWSEAEEYCKKAGKRLPTEAEWEYAARAGTRTQFYWGNNMDDNYAWYMGNAHRQTQPVAQTQPNAWGLYDMSGNVSEWCVDWYDANYYRSSPDRNPQGPLSGKTRVLRGGDWTSGGLVPRSARRLDSHPDKRYNYYGCRCVRAAQ